MLVSKKILHTPGHFLYKYTIHFDGKSCFCPRTQKGFTLNCMHFYLFKYVVNNFFSVSNFTPHFIALVPVTPNGNATAFVQRSKTVSASCWIAAKYAIKYLICQLKRVPNVLTASLQRPHDVNTASMTFYIAQAVAAVWSRRAHGALRARTRRAQTVFTARTQRPHSD